VIALTAVTHDVQTKPAPERILTDVSLEIPADRRIALLGGTQIARKALFDLLSGIALPKSGRVARKCTVSFPVGFLGGFVPELTIRENVGILASMYDQDGPKIVQFISRFADLRPELDKPFGKLPRIVVRRLGLFIAYSMPFDVYLVTAGRRLMNSALQQDIYGLFKARAATHGMIVSTDPHFARMHCDMAMIMRLGQIEIFDDVEAALSHLDSNADEDVDDGLDAAEESNPSRAAEDWV
jgi:capsular polysaccharide transport system ATP-binding protein